MNNVVEIRLFRCFAFDKAVWSQNTGEVGKFITLFWQISQGYHTSKILVVFQTIAKILQTYCMGALI